MIIKVILFSIALLFAVGIAILGSESPELPTGILSFDPFSKELSRKEVREYKGGRRSAKAERQNKTRRNRSRK